jgi:hypothetical protein
VRLKCIACEALARAIYLCAANSPHIVDVELYRIGLHRDPDDLRARLQSQIDAAAEDGYDAIVMAYGLCGQSTAGLVAAGVPLVIPRAHDCITLFLGSRARYSQEFRERPGTYWYALDYVERSDGSMGLGAEADAKTQTVYDEYVAKYGQDNADYLMEVMGAWRDHYDRAAFIDMGVGNSESVEAETQEIANRRGWTFECMTGDPVLIRRLLEGDWGDDFSTLEPGQQVTMTYDGDVIGGCEPAAGEA